MQEPKIFFPTRAEIEALKEGDLAPNPFGGEAVVDQIVVKQEDIFGKLYVLYYTKTATGSGSISNTMKEDRIVRTVALSNKYKSHEIDRLEKSMVEDRQKGMAGG